MCCPDGQILANLEERSRQRQEEQARRQAQANQEERAQREQERLERQHQEERRRQEQERRRAWQAEQEQLQGQTQQWYQIADPIERDAEQILPKPTFRVLSAEEQSSMGKISRTVYRVKHASCQKSFAAKQALGRTALAKMKRLHRNSALYMPPIEATAEGLEGALDNNRYADFHKMIYSFNRHYLGYWADLAKANDLPQALQGLAAYSASANADQAAMDGIDNFHVMNSYLRNGRDLAKMPAGYRQRIDGRLQRLTDAAADGMKLARLPNDMAVQRNIDMDGLAAMLHLTEAEAEAYLRDFRPGSNTILQEKGVCSTSLCRGAYTDRQVELVILAHKGSAAVPVCGTDLEHVEGEDEILLAPGTKFRMLEVREIPNENGTGATWRVYLETLPMGGEGIPR